MAITVLIYDPQLSITSDLLLSLPITKDALYYEHGIKDLSNYMIKNASCDRDFGSGIENYISDSTDLNELNYLVAKLSDLDDRDFAKFEAILESGRHCNGLHDGGYSLWDLINIIDNLDAYIFHEGFDEQGYGEYLLTGSDNIVEKLVQHLRRSAGSREFEFVNLVENLVECADAEQYGKSMSYENDGDFISFGYIIKVGPFHAACHGVDDIPNEYRIASMSCNDFIKVVNTDLSSLMMEMHALGGNYTQDAQANFKAFLEGDCFIVASAEKLTVMPAYKVFQRDSEEHSEFLKQANVNSRVFYKTVQEITDIRHLGSIVEVPPNDTAADVNNLSLEVAFIDAEFKDGTNRTYSANEWQKISSEDLSRIAGTVERYNPQNEELLHNHIQNLCSNGENHCKEVSPEEFLADFNKSFMAKAQHPQPDMIRVAREAAAEVLARSYSEVYRLMPDGPTRLTPLDAVKSKGLWFTEYRDFAIKTDGLPGVEEWAKRTADKISRQIEAPEHNVRKYRDEEAL